MTIPGSANPLLLKSAAAAGPVQIERSLRFNSSDSASLSRVSYAGSGTFSCWVKRCKLGTAQTIISGVAFNASDQLNSSTAVFRDPSAWMHVLVSTSGTYVNGTSVASGSAITPGIIGSGCDLYLADIYFIDGQALTPSSFTEVSATTGQLIPKAYTGSFGTNGFWLKFSDNSAATATTLGKDYSGNSNNWTPNNLSVTAGAGNDSLVDTPTSVSATDTGIGGEIRGNYCTLNPLKKGSSLTFANGNLDQSGSGQFQHSTSTFVLTTGKWYFEITHLVGEGNSVVGLVNAAGLRANEEASNYLGQTANGYGFYANGQLINSGSFSGTWGTDWSATGSVIGCAFDADTGKIWFAYNGTWQASGNPATGANPAFTASNHNGLCPAGRTYSSGQLAFNFGQRSWAYAAPAGFKALCDTNLPAPVVAKPSTVMDVALYSGNSSTQSISGYNLSPDFVWVKTRSQANNNFLFDAVRGVGNWLISDSTTAETYSANTLTSFDSGGFTTGSNNDTNASGRTFVAWMWDAGTSTVTNTQGSITSQVRANVSAGFSVVTWTSPSSGDYTIGHGLGVAPSLVITKSRSASGDQWYTFHRSVCTSTSNYLKLSSTDGLSTYAGAWGATLPTSTVVGLNAGGGFIPSSATAVAYCFAPVSGYSSFGSYTGNGSENGPFVYTGFRPRWILLKDSTNAGNWELIDTARLGYNGANYRLYPNLSEAETADNRVDILSNGFKIRTGAGTAINSSNAVIVYACFAESPFAYSRAR